MLKGRGLYRGIMITRWILARFVLEGWLPQQCVYIFVPQTDTNSLWTNELEKVSSLPQIRCNPDVPMSRKKHFLLRECIREPEFMAWSTETIFEQYTHYNTESSSTVYTFALFSVQINSMSNNASLEERTSLSCLRRVKVLENNTVSVVYQSLNERL